MIEDDDRDRGGRIVRTRIQLALIHGEDDFYHPFIDEVLARTANGYLPATNDAELLANYQHLVWKLMTTTELMLIDVTNDFPRNEGGQKK